MPLIQADYSPPLLFKNGHFSTIYQGLFRRVKGVVQKRERLELLDGDFLDLDWSFSPATVSKVVLLIHGLEGDAQRHYIKGSAKILNQNGFDVCAINLRGCSGEANRLYCSYHSGMTQDLSAVIDHVLQKANYEHLYLMGYSLGGNLILKYLGETETLPQQIKAGVGISVPCDLGDACTQLLSAKNYIYATRFKKHLLSKLRDKQQHFPERITAQQIATVRTLKDFDDAYTAPAHGFENAYDYYEKSSCLQFLPKIPVPALIVNALNDSFLGEPCYPYKEAKKNRLLHLETPLYGGHVGFTGKSAASYVEKRAVAFFLNY